MISETGLDGERDRTSDPFSPFDPSTTYWHLFYFDQRDMSPYSNHWKKGGAHVHYSRGSYVNKSLEEVWADVCSSPSKLPSSEHIRLSDPRERSFVGP